MSLAGKYVDTYTKGVPVEASTTIQKYSEISVWIRVFRVKKVEKSSDC